MQDRTREIAAQMGYITEQEFIELAGISPTTAEAWRKRGEGPKYALLGNKYFYSLDAVRDALGKKQANTEARRVGRPPKQKTRLDDSAFAAAMQSHLKSFAKEHGVIFEEGFANVFDRNGTEVFAVGASFRYAD